MTKTDTNTQDIIIVTGLSGAGLSSALKILEDLGYEVFDNFPVSLIDPLLKETQKDKQKLAIGIDTRTRGFEPDNIIEKSKTIGATLLFLNADEQILQKRFTETRRKHPLATDRPVSAGIRKELEILHLLRKEANLVIDTTELSIHDLRRVLEGHLTQDQQRSLSVTIMSFGFKYGIPREADIVMDVRFLRNPHWDEKLKPLTGQNPKVGTYIEEDESLKPFLENFQNLIEPLLSRYTNEGKNYLTIAIGCTGGKHRSVYVVETLSKWLKQKNENTHIKHRDMDRS